MHRDIPLSRRKHLSRDDQGLSSQQVAERKRYYGPNDILEVEGNLWFALARHAFKDPLIWLLIGTGMTYTMLGNYTEAVTLLVAILPLAGMDAFLHRRTQASTQGLSRQLASSARAVRDGRVAEVPVTSLVPGDLVEVASGEPFPADGLIVGGTNLHADESSLTGESYPVAKRRLTALPAGNNATEPVIWVDSDHWGFAGTRLLTGKATLRVVFTGTQTLYGEIVHAALKGNRESTPLQQAIANLVTLLSAIAGVLCLILAGIRLGQGHDGVDALAGAATLAVAALPEELPVVFSVYLGVGVYRLARRKALVRRAVSVETIGCTTCVCSDKTGTITEGRLRLAHLVPTANAAEADLLWAAGLASRPESGDPVDRAILSRLADRPGRERPHVVLATYPYTERRRRETAVVQIGGRVVALSKGCPELLLALSDLSAEQKTLWAAQVDRLAAEGHKVLACLHWELGDGWTGEPDRDGRLAGLLAFEDPIREGVIEAVQECREAGIRIIMVTGDHPATAASIARNIGLIEQSGNVALGDDVARALDHGDMTRLDDISVVARAMPSQKLGLVQALKARGEVVAVTGDGVNDLPALQSADIGIAMGERGTRSAREVASIVLLNDHFGTIVDAIAEGRQLSRNLQLSFQYILLIHIPLVITATFIPLTGHPLLYLPVHIVWLETLIHPTALLVLQKPSAREPLQALPKLRPAHFFSPGQWLLIGMMGTLLTGLLLWSYDRSLLPGRHVEHARAMAMVVLSCASASATAVLSRLGSKIAWLMTVSTVGLAAVLVQTPWLAYRLSLQPLDWDDWLIAAAGGLLCVAGPTVLFRAVESFGQFLNRVYADRSASAAAQGNQPAHPLHPESTNPTPLTRYAWLSVATAVATIALKTASYLITGSVALLSDAAESLVNLAAAAFALVILKVAARPADETHPFGHGKIEYFSSGFEGALILLAATGIAWAAWDRLIHPQVLVALDLGILVSVVATVLNLFTAGVLLRVGRRFGSITLEADGRHLMTDVWTTVAALLGLGGIAVTGWQWLDSAIAFLAALNIIKSGTDLMRRSLSGLLDAAIPAEERQRIERILEPYRRRGFQFHDLRARVAGRQRLITLHVLVPGVMSVQAAHTLLEEIESQIRGAIPNLLIVTHLEPLEDPVSFSHEIVP